MAECSGSENSLVRAFAAFFLLILLLVVAAFGVLGEVMLQVRHLLEQLVTNDSAGLCKF